MSKIKDEPVRISFANESNDMVDVELHDVTLASRYPAYQDNLIKNPNRRLTKLLFSVAIGLILVLSILLTLFLLFLDSQTSHANQSQEKSFIADDNLQENLPNFINYQNKSLEFPKDHYRLIRDTYKESDGKAHEIEEGSGETNDEEISKEIKEQDTSDDVNKELSVTSSTTTNADPTVGFTESNLSEEASFSFSDALKNSIEDDNSKEDFSTTNTQSESTTTRSTINILPDTSTFYENIKEHSHESTETSEITTQTEPILFKESASFVENFSAENYHWNETEAASTKDFDDEGISESINSDERTEKYFEETSSFQDEGNVAGSYKGEVSEENKVDLSDEAEALHTTADILQSNEDFYEGTTESSTSTTKIFNKVETTLIYETSSDALQNFNTEFENQETSFNGDFETSTTQIPTTTSLVLQETLADISTESELQVTSEDNFSANEDESNESESSFSAPSTEAASTTRDYKIWQDTSEEKKSGMEFVKEYSGSQVKLEVTTSDDFKLETTSTLLPTVTSDVTTEIISATSSNSGKEFENSATDEISSLEDSNVIEDDFIQNDVNDVVAFSTQQPTSMQSSEEMTEEIEATTSSTKFQAFSTFPNDDSTSPKFSETFATIGSTLSLEETTMLPGYETSGTEPSSTTLAENTYSTIGYSEKEYEPICQFRKENNFEDTSMSNESTVSTTDSANQQIHESEEEANIPITTDRNMASTEEFLVEATEDGVASTTAEAPSTTAQDYEVWQDFSKEKASGEFLEENSDSLVVKKSDEEPSTSIVSAVSFSDATESSSSTGIEEFTETTSEEDKAVSSTTFVSVTDGYSMFQDASKEIEPEVTSTSNNIPTTTAHDIAVTEGLLDEADGSVSTTVQAFSTTVQDYKVWQDSSREKASGEFVKENSDSLVLISSDDKPITPAEEFDAQETTVSAVTSSDATSTEPESSTVVEEFTEASSEDHPVSSTMSDLVTDSYSMQQDTFNKVTSTSNSFPTVSTEDTTSSIAEMKKSTLQDSTSITQETSDMTESTTNKNLSLEDIETTLLSSTSTEIPFVVQEEIVEDAIDGKESSASFEDDFNSSSITNKEYENLETPASTSTSFGRTTTEVYEDSYGTDETLRDVQDALTTEEYKMWFDASGEKESEAEVVKKNSDSLVVIEAHAVDSDESYSVTERSANDINENFKYNDVEVLTKTMKQIPLEEITTISSNEENYTENEEFSTSTASSSDAPLYDSYVPDSTEHYPSLEDLSMVSLEEDNLLITESTTESDTTTNKISSTEKSFDTEFQTSVFSYAWPGISGRNSGEDYVDLQADSLVRDDYTSLSTFQEPTTTIRTVNINDVSNKEPSMKDKSEVTAAQEGKFGSSTLASTNEEEGGNELKKTRIVNFEERLMEESSTTEEATTKEEAGTMKEANEMEENNTMDENLSTLNDYEQNPPELKEVEAEANLLESDKDHSMAEINSSGYSFLIPNRTVRSSEASANNTQELESDSSVFLATNPSARWSNQNSNNMVNLKSNSGTVSEHFQSSKQSTSNENTPGMCPTFLSPMGVPILQQTNTFPYLYGSGQLSAYPNILPLPIQKAQINPYAIQQYPYSVASSLPLYTKQQSGFVLHSNGAVPVASGGQYYMCYPVPSTATADVIPEAQIRETMDSINLQRSPPSVIALNKTREDRECPRGEQSCADGSKCIKAHHLCDGDVQCADASDETFCSCRLRISSSRICDGYFDCPNGEDEISCFGCGDGMFHCDDWAPRRKTATCIPFHQRCDGIPQCPTGIDEEDCVVLKEPTSEKQNMLVSSTRGVLYRNYEGRWYPVCHNPRNWVDEVCRVESGPSTIAPLTHLVPFKIKYDGSYISSLQENVVGIENSCEDSAAVFVECPPLVCGLRVKLKNPFRRDEVDTSAEQVLLPFQNSEELLKNTTEEETIGNSRIVGGNPSQPEAWPWVVSVYRNGVFHCGGALINEFWVVTAAHCVDRYWHYYFEVQAGVLRRYSFSPMVQNRLVAHIVSHQSYDRAKLKNDLALMKLSKPMHFNRYVRPICLPSEVTAGKNYLWGPTPKTICTVVGWGATVEHGTDPDNLREVEVYVFKRCKHREDEEGREICAGLVEGGKDACQGDSGGPFMCRNPNNPNQWYLAGIVSHGEGCARPNEPGVYTRVSLFLEWIFENIQAEVLPQTRPLRRCPGYICKQTNRCISSKRRCDKIVDCMLGDDEEHCERHTLNDIFKHAMRRMYLLGSTYNGTGEPQPKILQTKENIFNSSKTNPNFLCQKMMQVVSISKKCDGVADCEDATDEANCTCVEYLQNKNPDRICDGVTDCWDALDELMCIPCDQTEFYCLQSKMCIPKGRRCNNIVDCPMKEDEENCFALTDGKSIILDPDFRPQLKNVGLISFEDSGQWRTFCINPNTTEAALAMEMCFTLGFNSYESYRKALVHDNALKVLQKSKVLQNESIPLDKCTGLYVKCSEVLNGKSSDEPKTFIPWNAQVFVDGNFSCMGTIVEKEWIITSSSCFSDSNQSITVLLGAGRSYLNIRGPYEQIINVKQYIKLPKLGIVLLKPEQDIKFSRYVRSLFFNTRDYNDARNDKCVVTGRKRNATETLFLDPLKDCAAGYRCFNRIYDQNCSQKAESWTGAVTCNSKNGWYPAAVFHEPRGQCGFSNVSFTSIQFWKSKILNETAASRYLTTNPSSCKGIRCNLGNCLESNKVCDGVPDCRNGEDEDLSFCNDFRNKSLNTACLKSEMRCQNGRCISKMAFCDLRNDCGDWSDEPSICNCSSYLALTNPQKICDGIPNCYDKTDEHPSVCNCSSGQFQCGESVHCVPNEYVCDGAKDCPQGEDESECYALKLTSNSPPEVHIQTSGVWHPGCFPESLTTLQLEAICAKIGYTAGSAKQIHHNVSSTEEVLMKPVTDTFSVVRVHRNESKQFLLAIRSGEKAFVHFEFDSKCRRLFLECL